MGELLVSVHLDQVAVKMTAITTESINEPNMFTKPIAGSEHLVSSDGIYEVGMMPSTL